MPLQAISQEVTIAWMVAMEIDLTKSVTLNNGVEMPRIGYGVYLIAPGMTERCVHEALSVGYRSIDTAQCYGNEKEVGIAVRKSGRSRNEVFITTKLWGCSGYRDTQQSIDASLRRLDLGYIDLLLIHEPTGYVPEIYRAMEDACRTGKLRAIGVANFLDDAYLHLVEQAEIIPAVNQVETHAFRQQASLRKLMKSYGTQAEAWSPLAAGRNGFFTQPVLTEIARTHGKSVAQVGLRFLYQQDIIVIPKSTHIERMRENREIEDFVLTDEEMQRITLLDKGKSLFNWW